MKHGELIRRINKIAKTKGLSARYSEGGSHTSLDLGDKHTTIPRHAEVNERTAKAILKYLEGAE